MHHLGTFEGGRHARSRGYREPCSASRMIASAVVMVAFVFCLALVLGAI